MAHFAPTPQWFPDPFRLNAERMGVMAPQLSSPPVAQQNPMAPSFLPMQPQQNMPIPEESPVTRGIASGIGAGRQSIDVDQSQHDRLMGLAIAKMFGGLARGNQSVLGSLNAGLGEGIDDYMRGAHQMQSLNQMEMERQDRLAREAQAQQEREEQRRSLERYRTEALGIQRERLGNKEAVNGNISTIKVGDREVEGIPLASMPKNEIANSRKEMRAIASSGRPIEAAIHTLDEMQKLSDENPHLGESFALAYFGESSGKGYKNVLRNVSLGKNRTAVEKFGKLSSNLVKEQIKGMRGVVTDRMKKILLESTPQSGMTKESIDYLIDQAKQEAMPFYEDSLNAKEGLLRNVYIPPQIREYESQQPRLNKIDDAIYRAKQAGYTDEDIDMIMAE